MRSSHSGPGSPSTSKRSWGAPAGGGSRSVIASPDSTAGLHPAAAVDGDGAACGYFELVPVDLKNAGIGVGGKVVLTHLELLAHEAGGHPALLDLGLPRLADGRRLLEFLLLLDLEVQDRRLPRRRPLHGHRQITEGENEGLATLPEDEEEAVPFGRIGVFPHPERPPLVREAMEVFEAALIGIRCRIVFTRLPGPDPGEQV